MINYDWLQQLAAGKPKYNIERKELYEAYFLNKLNTLIMDLNKLDDLLNSIDHYSDSELLKLYDHSLNMQFKYQESDDDLALEYWSDLAKMILCQQEKRRLVNV